MHRVMSFTTVVSNSEETRLILMSHLDTVLVLSVLHVSKKSFPKP